MKSTSLLQSMFAGLLFALAMTSPAHAKQEQGPAAAPVIADDWLMLNMVGMKGGPGVCPLGVGYESSITKPCGGAKAVTVAEYFDAFVKTCPGATPVSATPQWLGHGVRIILGYKNPATGRCPEPIGARRF